MGRKQQYEIRLSEEEREYLLRKTAYGDWSPRQVKRGLILLKADKNQDVPLTDEQIANELHCAHATVNYVREKFLRDGRLASIVDKPRSGRPKIIDGEVEAHIVATACSLPPEGQVRWTLQLIADRVVQLAGIESCSHMSVDRTLKKTNLSLG